MLGIFNLFCCVLVCQYFKVTKLISMETVVFMTENKKTGDQNKLAKIPSPFTKRGLLTFGISVGWCGTNIENPSP